MSTNDDRGISTLTAVKCFFSAVVVNWKSFFCYYFAKMKSNNILTGPSIDRITSRLKFVERNTQITKH